MEDGRWLHAVPLRFGRPRPVQIQGVRHLRVPPRPSGAACGQHDVLRPVHRLRVQRGRLPAGTAVHPLLAAGGGAAGIRRPMLPAVPVPATRGRLHLPQQERCRWRSQGIQGIQGRIRRQLRRQPDVERRRLRRLPLRGR